MNYEEKSDFEINQLVALAIGMKVKTEFEETHGFTKKYHEKYPNTIWVARCDDNGKQIDAWEQKIFTNSPEDAWPIIVENKISINAYDNDEGWSATTDTSFFVDDDNPLRAAMICFLNLKEQSNDSI